MKSHRPSIKKKWKWKVEKLEVTSGDEVTWTAEDGKMTIWFPPGGDPLNIGEATIPAGTSKFWPVPGNANKGEYPYCIFYHEHNEMAEGNSPPTIIIK